MYKCTECGKEFNICPDYCDCGNDIFDEISIQPDINVKSTEDILHIKNAADIVRTPVNRTSIKTQSVDAASLLIFVLCIVLSILSIIFIGRDNSTTSQNLKKETAQPQVSTAKNIPHINDIWKESAVVQKDAKNSVSKKVSNTSSYSASSLQDKIKQILPTGHSAKSSSNTNKTVQQKPKTTVTTNSNSASRNKTQTTNRVSSPKQTSQTQVLSPNQPKNKTSAPSSQQQIKTSTTIPSKIQTTQQSTHSSQTVSKPTVDYAAQQKEYTAYKVELRNKIASNINFAAVTGDGNCIIAFKIDSSGNLIDRAFIQQSSNDSLNDAVYSAMMKTPSYKSPPAAYKKQTLKLSVKIFGGNFEVNLN